MAMWTLMSGRVDWKSVRPAWC